MAKLAKNRQHKLEKIYEAALAIFSKFGFKKTTMEDIAKELGMTKGNIYLYANNKRDLYEKSILHALYEFQNHVVKAFKRERDVVKQIISMSQAGFEYISKNDALRSIIINDPDLIRPYEEVFSPENIEEHYEFHAFARDMLSAGLKQGIKENRFRKFDADYIADLLSQIYMMFIRRNFVISKGKSIRKTTEEIVNLVLYGIVNDRGGDSPKITYKGYVSK